MTNKLNPLTGFILCLLIKLTVCQDPVVVQQQCCAEGQTSAQSSNCETSFVPRPHLNPAWNEYCFSIFRDCCSRKRDESYCGQGKEIAEMGGDCANYPASLPGSEMVFRCCAACNAGMDIAKSSGTCSIQAMNMEDTAYTTCCNTIIQGIRASAVKSEAEEGEETPEEGAIGPQPSSNETITTEQPPLEETTTDFCEKCTQGCGDGPDGKPICTCSSAFELDADGKTCLDRDECLENPCKEEEICQNLVGGYDCIIPLSKGTESHSCQPGEVFDPTTSSCVHTEDNEIVDRANIIADPMNNTSFGEENNHVKDVDSPHEKNETSSKIDPKCKEGYRVFNGHCVDIDECAENPKICDGEEDKSVCFNYDGGYYCKNPKQIGEIKDGFKNDTDVNEDVDFEGGSGEESCLNGYIWNEELKECEDEDECETGNYYCFTGEICENTEGSYSCDKADCDDDEKFDAASSTCVPKDQCESGFRFNPIQDECENIDECLEATEGKSLCENGLVCEDTQGSYNCVKSECGPGYELGRGWFGKKTCQDIDECTLGKHNCTVNEICVNTDGSFECDCNLGYKKGVDGICEDIDECIDSGVAGINPCNSFTTICVNTPGSYNCSCKDGYKQTSRNTCDDIKECDKKNACAENQICIEKIGSYECKCRNGFRALSNGTCISPEKPCHGFFNDDGVCSCPQGFKLNSTDTYESCEDVNECDDAEICSSTEHCVNTFGRYKCVDISCPKGYEHDGDSRFWCYHGKFDIKMCKVNATNCIKQFEEPLSISHSFVTAKSNVPSGKLYEVVGMHKSGYYYNFLIHKVNVLLRKDEILSKQEEANLERDYKFDHLKLERSQGNVATLYLQKPIEGPRDFVVEIDVMSRDQAHLSVLHRSVVHVFVSEYDGKEFSKP